MDFLGFLFVYYLHVWWIPYLACSEHIVCCTPRPLTIAYGQVWNPTLEHIGSPRLVLKELTRYPHNWRWKKSFDLVACVETLAQPFFIPSQHGWHCQPSTSLIMQFPVLLGGFSYFIGVSHSLGQRSPMAQKKSYFWMLGGSATSNCLAGTCQQSLLNEWTRPLQRNKMFMCQWSGQLRGGRFWQHKRVWNLQDWWLNQLEVGFNRNVMTCKWFRGRCWQTFTLYPYNIYTWTIWMIMTWGVHLFPFLASWFRS